MAGGSSIKKVFVVVFQSLSHVQLFVIPWTEAFQASLSFISWSLLRLMSIESVTPSNHLILCCPFSSCCQSFPTPGSFPMSQLFTSGYQSIGASASILPVTIQGWFPLELSSLISLLFRVLSRGFPGCSSSKESACNAGNLGLILESERSPAEGNQYSCMENSVDRGM